MTKDLFGNPIETPPTSPSLGRRDHLTHRGNATRGRHGWLRLTPAYSLHVVERILRECDPNEFVLEPFCGTGTTAVVAAGIGLPCDAFDINPFLVWLGALKTHAFDAAAEQNLLAAAEAIIHSAANRPRSLAWVPPIHEIEKWWDEGVLVALSLLHHEISQAESDDAQRTRDLLRVAFCRVLIQTAHVTFGHQSMSFRRRDSAAADGLLSNDPFDETVHAFRLAVRDVADSLDADQPRAAAHIQLADSRRLPADDGPRYTRVVTSPPYPNRMSYIRELRPYMYWLGYLTTGRQAGELDWQAIGGTWGSATSALGNWSPPAHSTIPYSEFAAIVEEIGREHALLGRYVHRYFVDIQEHIESLRAVLTPRARCHYVVGNSKFYGTLLPVERIYAALFADAGFTNVDVETLRKRTSKKELYEFVVHAEMP